MKSTKVIAPLALLAVALLVAYPLYAHCGKCAADGKKIATQLDRNKFTLAKAATAAEEHSKGRAISAITELNEQGDMMLHVYCLVGDPPKIMKCYVDTASGTVKGMKEVQEFPVTQQDHAQGDGHEGHGAHGGAPVDNSKGQESAKPIAHENLEFGCGSCIYKMPGVEGCHLAVMIDGKPYLVEGVKWPNHDFCDRKVQAAASGKLQGDKFIASSLEPKK